MTWTCGQCPARVRQSVPGNPYFVVGECGWLLTGQRADTDECPATLAQMEQMQASYLRQWGYPCDRLALAIEARKADTNDRSHEHAGGGDGE